MLEFTLILLLVLSNEATGNPVRGSVRLISNTTSTNSSNGIFQIYTDGGWGNICIRNDNSFTITEANVLCHHLGYANAISYNTVANNIRYGSDPSPALLSDINCPSSGYLNILQCQYNTTISPNCTDSNDVVISCSSTRIWDNPYDGMIRLMGGEYTNEGRVEIYCNGAWGAVCNDAASNWENDGPVICHQLGYQTTTNDFTSLSLNVDDIPVWIDSSNCPNASVSCYSNTCTQCPAGVSSDCESNDTLAIICYSPNVPTRLMNTRSTCQMTIPPPSTNVNVALIVGVVVAGLILVIIVMCSLFAVVEFIRKGICKTTEVYTVETTEYPLDEK